VPNLSVGGWVDAEHTQAEGGARAAPLFDKTRRDGSSQWHDSYRSARSYLADRWARGASPTR
jgi:hypothetical protein